MGWGFRPQDAAFRCGAKNMCNAQSTGREVTGNGYLMMPSRSALATAWVRLTVSSFLVARLR